MKQKSTGLSKMPPIDPPPKVLVVVAPYYRDITDGLLQGVDTVLHPIGGACRICTVAGALEIAPAIQMMRCGAMSRGYDGFIALGCVIRGQTTHYDTVCTHSARALMTIALQGVPIGNGILTVENRLQAEQRITPDYNYGAQAAHACLSLIVVARCAAHPPDDWLS